MKKRGVVVFIVGRVHGHQFVLADRQGDVGDVAVIRGLGLKF